MTSDLHIQKSSNLPTRAWRAISGERGLRWAVVLFFALYLVLGMAIFADYGGSWDEPLNRDLGQTTLDYLLARAGGHPVPWATLSQGLVAEQGPFFETILSALEAGLGLQDARSILLMRHLATFLVYWLGTLAFYSLLRIRFGDRRLALAGVALLVLTPRLFAHSFYNSKDSVLSALFMIGMLTMLSFARRQTPATLVLHALVCAAAVGIRVVGLLLPAVTLVVLCLQFAGQARSKRDARRSVAAAGWYLGLLALCIFLFWPALWEHPITALLHTFQSLASARQIDNSYSLYFGDFLRVDQLPWHYLPVWMLITLPLSHLLLFAAGLWVSARGLVGSSWLTWENVQNIAFTLLFFVPLLAVIVIRPVLYDDWRHLYFVYPAFVAMAVTGLRELCARPLLRRAAWALMLLALLQGAVTIIRYHPYQNVYFNLLAGKDVESRFELDYWGLSFREGLAYVLRTDPADPLRVAVSDYPGVVNSWLLDRDQRRRLRIVPLAEADWFLSNHRQPSHFADFRARRFPCRNEAYAVRVNGATLLGVYRLR